MEILENLSNILESVLFVSGNPVPIDIIAEKLGVNAVGVAADLDDYSGQLKRDLREIAARDKDFFSCLFKPKPKYLGEKIPVSGDGNITDG